jgi:hypothetical protein
MAIARHDEHHLKERKPRRSKSSRYSPRGGRSVASIIACDTMKVVNAAYGE